MDIGHLHQCPIHHDHYSRKRGKCIECLEQWQRAEAEKREEDRAKQAIKKAQETGNAQVLKVKNKTKYTKTPKPGKRPITPKKMASVAELAPAVERAVKDEQDEPKVQNKARDPTLYKAKKKWRDDEAGPHQSRRWYVSSNCRDSIGAD